MRLPKRLQTISIAVCLFFVTFSVLYFSLSPEESSLSKTEEDGRWILTSKSWLDRTACRWISICGGTNWLDQTWVFKSPTKATKLPEASSQCGGDWLDSSEDQKFTSWTDEERRQREIPQYIFEYAPLVFLHPEESYWPSDPAKHLQHTIPRLKNEMLHDQRCLSLANLSDLNRFGGGENVFLSSKDDVQALPPWLLSQSGIPIASKNGSDRYIKVNKILGTKDVNSIAEAEGWLDVGAERHEQRRKPALNLGRAPKTKAPGGDLLPHAINESSYSAAPAVLIVVEKENNVCDAFWFYFNSFNQGNKVFGIRFGNHVGDWEHSMVRFHHGAPKAIYTSRHSFGISAYSYDAVEKVGDRPVVYAARGSHAMYVTAGIQSYKLPFNLLHDTTARGPLWDPTILSLKSYTYDITTESIRASTLNPTAATSWFDFRGRWGDKAYSLGDRRQYRFAGEYHYASGPTGPRFKKLDRRLVCEKEPCIIKSSIR